MSAQTRVDAEPRSHREAAGLILWYDRDGWIWLQVTWDAEHGRHLRVVSRDDRTTERSVAVPVPPGPLRLYAALDGPSVTFGYAGDDEEPGVWHPVSGTYDAWRLSDDHGPRLRFTGMFVGIRADDLDGRAWSADFDYVDVAFERADG